MKFLKSQSVLMPVVAVALMVLTGGCAINSQDYVSDDIYADDVEIQEQEELAARREGQKVYRDNRFEHNSQQYREPYVKATPSFADMPQEVADTEGQYDYDSTTYVDTAEFDMDNYYDYAYAARLKRFHNRVIVYDYYDNFYTDLCWYDPDPWMWGTSIYLGYRWWYPSMTWHYGWGWNHYYGWNHWHYDPWGWDYYAWGGPHYWGGHHHHWDYHRPWYYNSRDYNSNFYRPDYGEGRIARGNTVSGGTGYRGEPGVGGKTSSFGEKYLQRYGSNNTITNNNRTVSRGTTARNTMKPTTIRPNNSNVTPNNRGNRLQKPTTTSRSITPNSRNNHITSQGNNTRTNNSSTINTNSRRTYTPPSVRQQRNTNEYRKNTPNTTRTTTRPTMSNSNSSSRSISPSRSTSSRSSMGSSSRGTSHSSGSSSHSGGSISRGGRR